jgi:hypothetical protein
MNAHGRCEQVLASIRPKSLEDISVRVALTLPKTWDTVPCRSGLAQKSPQQSVGADTVAMSITPTTGNAKRQTVRVYFSNWNMSKGLAWVIVLLTSAFALWFTLHVPVN